MLPSSGQMCPYSVSQFERSREQDPGRRPHILLAFFALLPAGPSWAVPGMLGAMVCATEGQQKQHLAGEKQ